MSKGDVELIDFKVWDSNTKKLDFHSIDGGKVQIKLVPFNVMWIDPFWFHGRY